MFLRMKFMDGSPVPEEYERAVQQMISDACDADEMVDIDELERAQNQGGQHEDPVRRQGT